MAVQIGLIIGIVLAFISAIATYICSKCRKKRLSGTRSPSNDLESQPGQRSSDIELQDLGAPQDRHESQGDEQSNNRQVAKSVGSFVWFKEKAVPQSSGRGASSQESCTIRDSGPAATQQKIDIKEEGGFEEIDLNVDHDKNEDAAKERKRMLETMERGYAAVGLRPQDIEERKDRSRREAMDMLEGKVPQVVKSSTLRKDVMAAKKDAHREGALAKLEGRVPPVPQHTPLRLPEMK